MPGKKKKNIRLMIFTVCLMGKERSYLAENNQNYVEPDISVICDKNKITDKGCQGAPDWIIEIESPGSDVPAGSYEGFFIKV